MTNRMLEIGIRRGRLLERIAIQRAELGRQMQPVAAALATSDRIVAGTRRGFAYLKQHPGIVVAAVALLVALKPKRAWRWAQRGFFVWRTWRSLRRNVMSLSRH